MYRDERSESQLAKHPARLPMLELAWCRMRSRSTARLRVRLQKKRQKKRQIVAAEGNCLRRD
jgi:hypothetical protein